MSNAKQRNRQGQFQSPRTMGNLYFLLASSLLALMFWIYGEYRQPVIAVEMIHPGHVMAVGVEENLDAPTPQPSPFKPVEAATEPHKEKKDYVRKVFGEDGEKMVTIISECENGTWDQSRVNTYNRDGSVDYGIGQVNSKNDYLCKDLDYINNWQDNIQCSYRIYKLQGLSAWACSGVVGIVPFHLKGDK